jgi:2-polyprenyl-3-methyl-5-hydroxy-6-metoxy-1,4-benzoquinol methylase
MMDSQTYTEFNWASDQAGNGSSGEGLTDVFVRLVGQLESVKSICDLGCGNGHIAGRLASRGYDVTGIDASRSGIEIARRRYPGVTFVEGMIDRELPGGTKLEKFDLVISSDVIEHLYRPADLLELASSLVKPGGHLLIGTPYHGYLKNLVLAVTGKMDNHFSVHHDGGHIKFFSVKTLCELVSNHSFGDPRFEFYGRGRWLWKNMICHARRTAG